VTLCAITADGTGPLRPGAIDVPRLRWGVKWGGRRRRRGIAESARGPKSQEGGGRGEASSAAEEVPIAAMDRAAVAMS
jgi:hypothetical protein